MEDKRLPDIDEDKKPKQRHRVLVNPPEIGLTARIRKALLDSSRGGVGITQRIRMAMVKKTQDETSFFFMKKNHFIMVGSLLALAILLAYAALRNRVVDLQLEYPGNKTATIPNVSIGILDGTKKLPVPDYPRTLTLKRFDIYGEELKEEDYWITKEDGNKVDPKAVFAGVYTLHINKTGYKPQKVSLEIGKVNVEWPVKLEPLVEPKRELKLYIHDPLETREIEPDNITIVGSKQPIKGVNVKPGEYPLQIEKAGYVTKQVKLYIPESGIVADKIPMDYQPRQVKFLVNDGLAAPGNESELAPHEIKLYREGKQISFTKEDKGVMPGNYEIDVERDGYHPVDKTERQIKILAAGDVLILKLKLVPKDREVVVVPNYDLVPPALKPDQAYLTPMSGSNKAMIPITDGLKIAPGPYWVKVEKANYHPFSEQVQIIPGSKPFEIKAHLISISKLLLLKITSDYDVKPDVNPDELLFDMKITKPGYVAIDWGNVAMSERRENAKSFQIYSLPREKKEIEVPVFLETIPREVVAEITTDITAGFEQQFEVLSLIRMMDGRPLGQTVDLRKTGAAPKNVKVKPGRYVFNLKKLGFNEINEEIIIDPNPEPYVIQKKLKAQQRPLMVELDTDYDPGKEVSPDELKLDRKPIESGIGIKPGNYILLIRKDGYYPVERTLNVTPGSEAIRIKEQLKAKPRRIVYEVLGENFEKIYPDVVALDRNPIRENQEVPPKKGYEIRIEKKGYEALKESKEIPPGEEPFALKANLKTLKRLVQLTLKASFPAGKDLLPANEALIDTQTIGNDTEVKPGKHRILLTKDGYKAIDKMIDILPDDTPFKIDEIMYPKDREINLEIDYDVASENTKLINLVEVESEGNPVKQIKSGDKVEPNKYKIQISTEGYEKLTDNVIILPAETSHTLKYTLVSLPRTVIVKITSDYIPGKDINADKILLNGKPFSEKQSLVSKVKPGRYSLQVEKAGYHPFTKDISIPAGITDYTIAVQLNTTPRLILYEFRDSEKPDKILIPDKISLGNMPVSQQNSTFKPGKYRLMVSIQGYPELVEDLEIEPGVEPYRIERRLVASSRIIKYELTGDYNTDPLTPTEITLNGKTVDKEGTSFAPGPYDLAIYVPGYDRLRRRIEFEASRDPFIIREKLNSKLRKIVFNITGTYPENTKLTPDKALVDEKPFIEGQELKPKLSGYPITLIKDGYFQASKTMDLPPAEEPYVLEVKLQATPRRVVFELDSDYKPGELLQADSVTLDERVYRADELYDPGKRQISISKVGYQPQQFEYTIPTGAAPITIKRTLITLPREVAIKVISEFTGTEFEPEVLTLGNRRPEDDAYKPGTYEMNIEHLGYMKLRENVEILPGEGKQEFQRTLVPRKRRVLTEITYDRAPRPDSPAPIIKLKNPATSEEYRVQDNDELKPAEYQITIEKEGFETLTARPVIDPEERAFILKYQLISKPIEILIDISYDIEPPASLPDATVTFIEEQSGAGRNVSHGKLIKPGEYSLDVGRPGYKFENKGKKLLLMPGTEPFLVKEKLFAKPRSLSFDMQFKTILVKASAIFIDGQPVKASDTFKPGQDCQLLAKFKDYKTAQKRIKVPPGEGPYVVDLELTKFSGFEFHIGKRFFEKDTKEPVLMLDNIRYSLEIFADNEPVESHQIFGEMGVGFYTGNFYAASDSKKMRFVQAFYFDEADAGNEMRLPDLRRIDAHRLSEHLKAVAKRSPKDALKRVSALMNDKSDKPKILNLSREEKDQLMGFLRDLELTDPRDQQERNKIVKEL